MTATEVSPLRLYALRASYLIIVVGLAWTIWPTLIRHPDGWPFMNSVVSSLLGGLSVLALVGIRYPLRMLPILLFELTWKAIWLLAVAVPLFFTGQLDGAARDAVGNNLLAVILIPVIPWRYVVSNYVLRSGDRWGRATAATDR